MADKSSRPPSKDESFFDKLKDSIPPKGDPGRKQFHFSLWYFLMALLLLSLVHDYFIARQVNTITYSDFKGYVHEGRVDELTLKPQRITGFIKEELEDEGKQPFVAIRVDDPELVKLLDEKGIEYTGRYESRWIATLLAWVLPLAIFLVIWRYLLGRMGGGRRASSQSASPGPRSTPKRK
jgi:cell division protease FtsH